LLRGINVGGRNKVAMADLRAVVASLGHDDVATYIQSGNVVFTSNAKDPAKLARDLERAIAEQLGVRPDVVVLSRADLRQVISGNPYPDDIEPRFLHAVFRQQAVDSAGVAAIAAAQQRARDKGSDDAATVVGSVTFLRTPGGLGRSELAVELARPSVTKATGTPGTARNWATVTKLMDMLEG
jgi:uncharacterized protein (DUF1697 family)